MKNVHEFDYPYNLLRHLGVLQESDIYTELTQIEQERYQVILHVRRFDSRVFIGLHCPEEELLPSIEYVLRHLPESEYTIIQQRYNKSVSFKSLAETYHCRVEEIEERIDGILHRICMQPDIKYIRYGIQQAMKMTEEEWEQKLCTMFLTLTFPLEDLRENEMRLKKPRDLFSLLNAVDILSFHEALDGFRIDYCKAAEIGFKDSQLFEYNKKTDILRVKESYLRKIYAQYNQVGIPDGVDIHVPIEKLALPTLYFNRLKRAGFGSVEDILEYGIQNLHEIPQIGNGAYQAILSGLTSMDIQVNHFEEHPKGV